jgi:DinB family protein
MRLVFCASLLALPLAAAPLERGERDRAMSELHATRKMLLDSISGLSEAQWKFKAGPDRWSIAECAEHILLAEDALFHIATEKILKGTPASAPQANAKDRDAEVLRATADRTHKAQAPEMLRPVSGKWPTPAAAAEEFRKRRDRTIAYIDTTQEDLRAHSAPHPVFKSLDAYQWILFLAAHSDRHTQQINEVKASPGYPK